MGFIMLTVYVSYVATSSMESKNKMLTYIIAFLLFAFMLIKLFKGGN